jgi:ribosomal protein L7/L12
MPTETEVSNLRERVIRLEGQLKFLYEKLNIEFVADPHAADDPKVVELIKLGKKLDAITMYRQVSGTGLAEAKNAVEEMQGRLGL